MTEEQRQLFAMMEQGPVVVTGKTKLIADWKAKGLVVQRGKKAQFTIAGAYAWRRERELRHD